ncbi:signal peptide peptidase SppA [Algiphilus sp.]|uniref:signal peptide peptidase SppA n=1 Tax=Algiphilus sp. TaxID=1872431 RepID=UPI003CCC07BC
MKYGRIIRAVCETPWAITANRMADIIDVLAYQAAGGKLTPDEVRAYVGDDVKGQQGVRSAGGGVAILSLRGVIAHRIESVQDISGPGGTSMEGFSRRFREVMNDDEVSAVVIDVDSPGGAVSGVEEMGKEIREARGTKPIVAVANTLAASAAYHLASQADELVVTPSGEVGSIGVFAAHQNMAQALESMGIEVTLISAGKYKVEGNPYEALSDDAREYMQSRVDDFYEAFVNAVAAGRGVLADAVKSDFGQGRVVGAQDAVAAGMADSVETFDQVVARLRSGTAPKRRTRASRAGADLRRYELAFK